MGRCLEELKEQLEGEISEANDAHKQRKEEVESLSQEMQDLKSKQAEAGDLANWVTGGWEWKVQKNIIQLTEREHLFFFTVVTRV